MKFRIDEQVYIVAIRQFTGDTTVYTLGFNGVYFDCYETEISKEKDTLKKLLEGDNEHIG